MSWDVSLSIDTGGKMPKTVVEVGNYTFNVSHMYFKVFDLGFTATLNKKLAGECIPILKKAIDTMKNDPQKFKALSPSNGWGSYEGALEFLNKIYIACNENPKCTIDVF